MIYNPTTPGTRLAWDDLAGWLATMDELVYREATHISAKTYRDLAAHLALLTPDVLATAQSVYEIDRADAYVRDNLPPKGKREGHPLTALMDAVNRTRTAFMHPHGSRSIKVTLSQPRLSHASDNYVSPINPLTRYVRSMPLSDLPKRWRLPYALERHPYLVMPLYLEAALPTLPPAPRGRKWVIDPDSYSDQRGSIRLVSARTGRIDNFSPEIGFIWFHSPRPWVWSTSGASSPGNATAREAAEALLARLGHPPNSPEPAPSSPNAVERVMWRLVGPHVTGAAAQIYAKEGNARRAAEHVPPPVDLEKLDVRLTTPNAPPEVVSVRDRTILVRGTPTFGTVTSVDIAFAEIDEWHSTTMTVIAVLPREWLQQSRGAQIGWVDERWSAIIAKLPAYRVPPPAPQRSSYRYGDYDEDEDDGGDRTDYPEPGLGWIDPRMMPTLNTSDLSFHAKEGPGAREITITLEWSHR